MNSEAVIGFLGSVPLFQRLPSLSLKKIAQFVVLKHFDSGDIVIRNGEAGQGVYFICKGEGEVSGSVHKEEFNHHNFELKQYGYFGNGTGVSAQQDVIALTKVNAFKGITLSEAPKSAKVFGGQFMGQEGANTSHVLRGQNLGVLYFWSPVASFCNVLQEEELGFDHQDPTMPYVPAFVNGRTAEEASKFEVYWFRAKAELSDDQPLHRKGLELTCTSLDHSMWFHRPFRADEWLLYVIDSPSTNYAYGFVSGQIFNRKGEEICYEYNLG